MVRIGASQSVPHWDVQYEPGTHLARGATVKGHKDGLVASNDDMTKGPQTAGVGSRHAWGNSMNDERPAQWRALG